MKILIPCIQAPFITGGGQIHVAQLCKSIQEFGHQVEAVSFPFKFSPEDYLLKSMQYCLSNDFENFNGHQIDRVIALQFPTYYVQHPNKVVWLMHQHRAVYELYDMQPQTPELALLKEQVHKYDTQELGALSKIYANSQNVSDRLQRYNQIESTPLYHPPKDADLFFCAPSESFIFCPSRLEALKRQDLLIKALQHTNSDIGVIIAGEGGQKDTFVDLVEELGLGDRVKFVGFLTEEEKRQFYAHSLAVFFGPYDEDYGYITLEAMLSSKPVITCTDSGGPLEFVENDRNGYVVAPEPEQIARVIDKLHADKKLAQSMGQEGRAMFIEKNITWHNVVEKLLG